MKNGKWKVGIWLMMGLLGGTGGVYGEASVTSQSLPFITFTKKFNTRVKRPTREAQVICAPKSKVSMQKINRFEFRKGHSKHGVPVVSPGCSK